MLLQVSYDEISNIISKKLGYDVLIAYKDKNKVTVSITMPATIPLIGNMNFSADVELLSVRNSSIVVDIDTGVKAFILNMIKSFLLSKMPTGLVESFDGQRLHLNLSALPQSKAFCENFDLNNVRFEREALFLDASMKFES